MGIAQEERQAELRNETIATVAEQRLRGSIPHCAGNSYPKPASSCRRTRLACAGSKHAPRLSGERKAMHTPWTAPGAIAKA
jgi:hypothetical protein